MLIIIGVIGLAIANRKLIVAGKGQRSYLENIISQINSLPPKQRPPLELIRGARAREMEPDLSMKIDSALYSPQTGIIDSHGFLESLEKEITNSEGGDIVCSTRVVRVDPYKADTSGGWIVQTLTTQHDTQEPSETDAILARVLINASGLNSHLILNSLLSPEHAIPMYYARGSYASYRGPGTKAISRLIYPVPELTKTGPKGSHLSDFQSLGVHLTLDMNGNIRFGPDIEWLTPPLLTMNMKFERDEEAIDFWKQHLRADEQQQRLEEMYCAITQYLPNITLSGLRPDYVGIRPKLGPPTSAFRDFEIRVDSSSAFGGSGEAPMITLLGFESPGLTASLAIGEVVVNSLKQWKIGS
ncbi:hypothetical protein Clacol_001777 [Clathrus columnatus]|uniref:L-2-hydroxyglutarate dehydrogenase, mitochondrial n=1 Tax=Clathrus columnatus TaxID=1419009 RepID=A0AAV4ZZ11_9AGAM|nr:hypothetical protein Clacol_001777 [Clathrus columnatus]